MSSAVREILHQPYAFFLANFLHIFGDFWPTHKITARRLICRLQGFLKIYPTFNELKVAFDRIFSTRVLFWTGQIKAELYGSNILLLDFSQEFVDRFPQEMVQRFTTD